MNINYRNFHTFPTINNKEYVQRYKITKSHSVLDNCRPLYYPFNFYDVEGRQKKSTFRLSWIFNAHFLFVQPLVARLSHQNRLNAQKMASVEEHLRVWNTEPNVCPETYKLR